MKISTRIFIAFSAVILLSFIVWQINQQLSNRVNENISFLTKSEEIIRTSTRLHKGIIEMQSGFRGFLLTEDETFLVTYIEGLKALPPLFKLQKSLVARSREQVSRLDSIQRLHRQWINYSQALIQAKREASAPGGSDDEYQELFQTRLKKQVGKNMNDAITLLFRSFDREEYRVREIRRVALRASISETEKMSLFFLVMTSVIILVTAVYVIRIISRRIREMVGLADNISRGRFSQIRDNKNDELSDLSVSLNAMSTVLDRNIRELENRNRELNQFAYVVSHDLKAPLRGIYNVLQWIEEDLGGELSQQMKKYLSIIAARISRLEELITAILNYARLSRDRGEVEQVDLKVLVSELGLFLIPKNGELILKELPQLKAEKVRLEQVFSNLISNAVKYNDKDQPLIEVGSLEREQFYEFYVKDNGPGIPEEFHEKIFVIFQTLRERDDQESTGIGLSIVKKIIEDQHGRIWVESEPGAGTTIRFTWPKQTEK